MALPDPSLGISASFDPVAFRNAVKFAMQMGTPPDEGRRPKFVRKSSAAPVYMRDGVAIPTPRLDRDGRPLDPTIRVVEPADQLVSVNCAVEIDRADAEELPVGNFRPTKAVVTLLDEDFVQVEDCKELIYNGDRYLFGYDPEANGLFEVGIHTRIFYAVDES